MLHSRPDGTEASGRNVDRRRLVLSRQSVQVGMTFLVASSSLLFREKKLLISGGDFGHDLTGVQNLQKKHGHLETELSSHNSAVNSLLSRGEELITEEHYASEEIKLRCEELKGLWEDLMKAAEER